MKYPGNCLLMGTSKSCKTSIKGLASGDKFVSNTKEIVNIFNTFFTNVGKTLLFNLSLFVHR